VDWIKVNVETTSNDVDTVANILMDTGISGVEIIDAAERAAFLESTKRTWDYAEESLLQIDSDNAYVVFYVTKDAGGITLLEHAKSMLSPRLINVEQASDETWLNEWKKHFKPIRVGKIVIAPEWEDYVKENDDDIVFIIDPGTAFGTGQHQTTKLCIAAVEKWINPDNKVIDIGCGSGILSIISLLVGASYVYAIDIDPAGAIAATKRNAELNHINPSQLDVRAGDVISDAKARADAGSGYDTVVANIVADVIIPLASVATQLLKPGGLFITSGIIDERLNDVYNAFSNAGITVLETTNMEGWNSVVGQVNA